MLTLRIVNNRTTAQVTTITTGLVKLRAKHAKVASVDIDGEQVNGKPSVTIDARLLSWGDWYDLYVRGKQQAMRRALLDNQNAWESVISPAKGLNYEFILGVFAYVSGDKTKLMPYLRTLNNCSAAPSGNMQMLGDLQVSLIPGDPGKIVMGIPKIPKILSKILFDCYYMIWRLYHAYNYLIARLLVYDPFRTIHKFDEYPLGRCLGTLLEYQAQVTRWNHYVWTQALSAEVTVIGEKLAVKVGYKNSECCTKGVKIKTYIKLENPSTDQYATNNLTIFRNGVTTNFGELMGGVSAPADVTRDIYKVVEPDPSSSGSEDPSTPSNSGVASGFPKTTDNSAGYEYRIAGFGKDPQATGVWTSIRIEVNIPTMVKGEYYEELFVLAVGYGEEAEISLPEDSSKIRYAKIKTTVVWDVDHSDCNSPDEPSSSSGDDDDDKYSSIIDTPDFSWVSSWIPNPESPSDPETPETPETPEINPNVGRYTKSFYSELPLVNVEEHFEPEEPEEPSTDPESPEPSGVPSGLPSQ